MRTFTFSAATAVFHPDYDPTQAIGQFGFYAPLCVPGDLTDATVRITARSLYRLFINGTPVLYGPARTAHGYARVDEASVSDYLRPGENHIAIEVVAYGRDYPGYNRYSNDCTLEDGLLIAEIVLDGHVALATGRDDFGACTVTARDTESERISHSRECTEVYHIDDAYTAWRFGRADFVAAVPVPNEPIYLRHDALIPTLECFPIRDLVSFGACRIDPDRAVKPLFYEVNSPVYDRLPEHPTADYRRTVDDRHAVTAHPTPGGLRLSGADSFYALYDASVSRVGFIRLSVTCEQDGILDIIHSELLDTDGTVPCYHNPVTRLHLPAGRTDFLSMEPTLARYLKLIFRETGTVTVHDLAILDDSYPDEHRATFLCSDENVNRLYNAAKLTLRLNTRDIFMDCPERERGGWLCDSLWTARAAALLLADTRVEREFLENFLLTPADGMFHAFFPEVYPASKPDYKQMTGITTWSFWLMCEVCEFIRRTGDITFRDEHHARIAAFVEGSRFFIGKSGLLENLPWLFIDWSMANYPEHNQPVSTAANALYAYMLENLGHTFGEPAWTSEARRIRTCLQAAILATDTPADLRYIPDCFDVSPDGTLRARDRYSEAAMYTALWAGLFEPGECPVLERLVRDRMGPAPSYAKDPNVGSSQLFIGLCIRLDMLARREHYPKLYADLRALFDPQLREGPGTLWENGIIDTSSRCHGFTAHAGVHLMRDILGLVLTEAAPPTMPNEPTVFALPPTDCPAPASCRHLTIAPHVADLRWARGTLETPDGLISVEWRYDGDRFVLNSSLPAGWDCDIELPREARALDSAHVSVTVTTSP